MHRELVRVATGTQKRPVRRAAMDLVILGEPRVFTADRFDPALFLSESGKFQRFHADDIGRVIAVDRISKLALPAEFNKTLRDVLNVLVVTHTHLHATVNRRCFGLWASLLMCRFYSRYGSCDRGAFAA